MGFKEEWDKVSQECFERSSKSGFWDDERNDGEMIALIHCYSDDTDVLTSGGWESIKSIVDSKKDVDIFTLNLDSGETELQKPTNYFSYYYCGDMFALGGKRHKIDLLVTPNHNIIYTPQRTTNLYVKEAQNMHRNFRVKRDISWKGEEEKFFVLPSVDKSTNGTPLRATGELRIEMDNWLDFLGWFLSEGSTFCDESKGSYTVAIRQRQEKNKPYIRESISSCGFNYCEGNDSFIISNKQLFSYLSQFGHSQDKFIPYDLKQLSSRQLRILISSLVKGDGGERENGYMDYSTNSVLLRDDFQEIALKAGFCSSFTTCKKDGYRDVFRISASSNGNYCRQNVDKDYRRYENYDGSVYCIEVPNHSMFVRRNGKTCWCGNSELSEALEFMRHGNPPSDHVPEISGVEEELADVIIRLMDMASGRGWDVAKAIELKMKFNETRSHKHGKEF